MVVMPQEFIHMRGKVEKLEGLIQVLKTVDYAVSLSLQDKLKDLEVLYDKFSVHTLCGASEVSRGTFYSHILLKKRKRIGC